MIYITLSHFESIHMQLMCLVNLSQNIYWKIGNELRGCHSLLNISNANVYPSWYEYMTLTVFENSIFHWTSFQKMIKLPFFPYDIRLWTYKNFESWWPLFQKLNWKFLYTFGFSLLPFFLTRFQYYLQYPLSHQSS